MPIFHYPNDSLESEYTEEVTSQVKVFPESWASSIPVPASYPTQSALKHHKVHWSTLQTSAAHAGCQQLQGSEHSRWEQVTPGFIRGEKNVWPKRSPINHRWKLLSMKLPLCIQGSVVMHVCSGTQFKGKHQYSTGSPGNTSNKE